MRLGHAFHKGEAEAEAAPVPPRPGRGSGEPVEDPIQVATIDTRAGVGHADDGGVVAPQDAQGNEDLDFGLREFVVGTGGASHYRFPGPPRPNSQVRDSTTFGVIVLTLYEDRYEWEFVPVGGGTFLDAGSGVCHP